MLPYDARALADLLLWQEGVVSRRQLLDLGARPHDVRRLLRRRDLNVVWPGTYVDHTGPLTQDQRAWAAVLHFAPAALCLDSALPRPDPRKPIHVAVALDRSVRPVEGVRVHRMAHLDLRRHPTALPPRVRVEHAAIDVALAQRDTAGTFRVLADVCQTRQTTAPLIAAALRDRPQVPHRGLLLELLDDLATGACSVLEREYLRLERVHGLPTAHRQRRDTLRGRAYYRDVPYDDFALDVELDGRAFHDTAGDREADLERDLDTIVDQATLTVRLGYAQVFTHGCRTIAKVATLLQKRGWGEDPVSCPDCSRIGATR